MSKAEKDKIGAQGRVYTFMLSLGYLAGVISVES
jgi:hypothetical protein